MATTNEAFARVKIDSRLTEQGSDTLNTNSVSFEMFALDCKSVDRAQPIQTIFIGASIAKSI